MRSILSRSTRPAGLATGVRSAVALLALALLPTAATGTSGPITFSASDEVTASIMPDTVTGEDRSILRVSAESRVEVSPDRARISFAVETEAEAAREAGEANARLMDQVVQAIQATGVEGLRTETSGYSLSPRYQPSRADQPRVIVGYTARNHLQVIVDDVEEVGRLLDIALEAGANRVAGLQFEIRDPEPHRRQALQDAVTKARTEAETIAGALGVRLGNPLEVQVGGAQPVFRQDMAFARAEMMAMDVAPTTPVEAGLQTVSANVNIHYRIHPD